MTYNLNLIQGHYPGEKLKADRKSMQLIEVRKCRNIHSLARKDRGLALCPGPTILHFTSKLILNLLAVVFFGVPVYFVC